MSAAPDPGRPRPTRRIVFQGLGALGVAAVLAGCAGADSESGASASPTSGTELTTTDQVPVGGGVVLTDARVVLTQPTEGDFSAFTAVCTHQQLLVTAVDDGQIVCANHGSAYSATTGEVEQGPATAPLAPIEITVDGDRILVA